MKNLSHVFPFLFGISLLIFISCGDDDKASGPVTANSNLEGTIWVQNSRIVSDCPDSADDESLTCINSCDAIIINNTGFIEMASNDGISSVTYTKDGTTLMVDVGAASTLDVSYAITGKTMTITYQEDSCNITETYSASESLELVGTSWGKVGETNNNCTDPGNDCDPCSFDSQTIQLLSDSTGTNTNQNGTQDITYTLNGNMVTVELDDNGQTVTLEFEYKIVSEILTLEYLDDNGCEVKEIYRGS